ncbi:MAG: hypothetical protein PWP45_1351 [Tepidanaerobacteraceae bacterium]|nr:hypothetical protein [Tepidanaerobacteraceae bacterium]
MQLWFTALSVRLAKNMKDRRGSGTLIFSLLFLIPFMTFSMFLVESRLLYTVKNAADDAVTAAALAALKSTNPVDVAYGEYLLDTDAARGTFYEYLRKNMKLDVGMNPIPGSFAAGPVYVDEFIVYNPGSYPTFCPRGTYIQNTAIHVVVRFKTRRPALKGLFGEYVDIVIHRDVDNFYNLQEE